MDASIFDSALSHTRRSNASEKKKKIACPLLDVCACGQVSSPRLYRLIYYFTKPLISMQFYYWSQLDKFTRFETRVESAVWNAVAKDWTLSLRNEKSREKSIEKFTFLVSCVGGLHVPNIPGRLLSNYQNAYSIQYLK